MQFAVPQFTDVEDKIIGPLTLKQFLFLLATGGVILFFWSILGFSIFFFLFALPFFLIGMGLAFGKLNGRPLYSYLGAFLSLVSKPQVRVFRREEPVVILKADKVTSAKMQMTKTAPSAETESRLKKLAYLLDQKTHEEQELIGKNG